MTEALRGNDNNAAEQVCRPLVSAATMERLELEAEELLESLEESDYSVGDALIVRYDKDWAMKMGIGRFGRMTMKGGEKTYHACPRKMDRTSHYDMPEDAVFSWARSWVLSDGIPPPVDHLVSLESLPVKKEIRRPFSISDYERALFIRLSLHNQITLVNPAFSSMVQLATSGGGFVFFVCRLG